MSLAPTFSQKPFDAVNGTVLATVSAPNNCAGVSVAATMGTLNASYLPEYPRGQTRLQVSMNGCNVVASGHMPVAGANNPGFALRSHRFLAQASGGNTQGPNPNGVGHAIDLTVTGPHGETAQGTFTLHINPLKADVSFNLSCACIQGEINCDIHVRNTGPDAAPLVDIAMNTQGLTHQTDMMPPQIFAEAGETTPLGQGSKELQGNGAVWHNVNDQGIATVAPTGGVIAAWPNLQFSDGNQGALVQQGAQRVDVTTRFSLDPNLANNTQQREIRSDCASKEARAPHPSGNVSAGDLVLYIMAVGKAVEGQEVDFDFEDTLHSCLDPATVTALEPSTKCRVSSNKVICTGIHLSPQQKSAAISFSIRPKANCPLKTIIENQGVATFRDAKKTQFKTTVTKNKFCPPDDPTTSIDEKAICGEGSSSSTSSRSSSSPRSSPSSSSSSVSSLSSLSSSPRSSARVPQCSDGRDNDSDGFTDGADSGCHTDGDNRNPRSFEPNDDDERDVGSTSAVPSHSASSHSTSSGASSGPSVVSSSSSSSLFLTLTLPSSVSSHVASSSLLSLHSFGFFLVPECGDGFDNDEDGKTDYPEDPDCTSLEDLDESTPPPQYICGNGEKEVPEECDDGNGRDFDGCTSSCQLEIGICGDGMVQKLLGEQCELSLLEPKVPFDCFQCRFYSPTCGNGIVDPAEECDDGAENSDAPGARCRLDCSTARCGDAIIDAPQESCDDGNLVGGDGCDRSCSVELPAASFTPPRPSVPSSVTSPYAFLPYQLPGNNFQFPGIPQNLLAESYKLEARRLPEQPETGPEVIAIMAAGAAGGLAWMRRRMR